MEIRKTGWVMLAMVFLAVACKDDDPVDCNVFEWSYEDESGPAHWQQCFADCGGQVQSPVNISNAVQDTTLDTLTFHYEDVPTLITNNGHTIEFEYEMGSQLIYEGTGYQLNQFHFHAMSEHTVAGQRYPLEAHLVHKDLVTGRLAVVGVLFETGNENPFFQDFIDVLPDEKDENYFSSELLNVLELLPADRLYYAYNGSLTTPPCSEIVSWIVLKTPVSISSQQLQRFSNILKDNNRPVQPLNGRQVFESL